LEPLTSGTPAGAGTFRCQSCGYVQTLMGSERLSDCPNCTGKSFERASLFSEELLSPRHDAEQQPATDPSIADAQETARHGGVLARPAPGDRAEQLAKARETIPQPGDYLCYEEGGELRTVPLAREWTRIGRSLAADVRFDDPTVSRRHALIVRQPDGVRVLDDRSLNGVFVNGERIDGQMLKDGDEIVVGRYRLSYLDVAEVAPSRAHPEGRTQAAAE
jgi:pSer/pThr/pTyr-binding forkhead associated (FHA) protein